MRLAKIEDMMLAGDVGAPPNSADATDKDVENPFPALFAERRRRSFVVLVIAGLAQGGLSAGLALLVKRGFNELFSHHAAPPGAAALLLPAALALLIFANGWLRWLTHVESEKIGQSYAHALRMRIFRRVVANAPASEKRQGAVLLRFSGDLTPFRQWVSRGLTQIIVSGLTILFTLAALFAIDARIALVVTVTLAVAGAISLIVERWLRRATAEARRSRGKLANLAGVHVGAAPVSPNEARAERRRARKLSRRVRDSLLERARYVGMLRAIAESGGALAGALALLFGAALAARSSMSPGSVVSAMYMSGLLAPQLRRLSRCLEYWTAAKVARERQLAFFRAMPGGAPPPATPPAQS